MEDEWFSDNKQATFSNVQDVCRICLSTYDTMISLLTTKENALLLDMFTSVSSIKVQSKDGLPLQICKLCETEVVNCYQFKVKCKKSNSILKTLLKKVLKKDSSSKVCLKDISESVEDHKVSTYKKETNNANVDYIDGTRVYKEEINTVEVEIKTENVEATRVEYLEDGIFESMETEVEKHTMDQNLTDITTENGDLQNSFSGLTKKRKVAEQSVRKDKRKYYSCSFCSKKFLKTRTLKLHMKQAHDKTRQPYCCGQCKDSFSTEQDLHIHSALHAKGNKWICNQCHKEFEERGKLRRHIRRHMASKRHACESCGKQFAERCALRRHARVHTGQAPEKRHACHICDKKYSEGAALAAHVRRHAGLRPCACECGKAFPSPRLLASHRRVHSDRKPHACDYCDKRFRHESTRNTHHRTHTGDKPYVCSACGKRFIQNSNLTLHMRTHTGEKPYSCDVCERKFSSGSALASHRRTHTGEKPYGCPICGKRFARVYLSSHMRQHTGERPFACCVCGKRFANAARLRQHHLIHTGEKPFECAMCSQKFKTKGYLAKHLKNHEMINNLEKRKVLILQQFDDIQSYGEDGENVNQNVTAPVEQPTKDNITVEVTEEMPLEVTGELILPNDEVKTELVVIDREGICLRAGGNYDNNEVNYNDVNLVTVNEGEVNISASSMLEGTTVKLYQLDQSLVQIHTSGGQVTISKITSKMTANF